MFEIERKFLVKEGLWEKHVNLKEYKLISQYYLTDAEKNEIRIRKQEVFENEECKKIEYFFTLKSKTEDKNKRVEIEFYLSEKDARNLIAQSLFSLSKIRYTTKDGFEIDKFLAKNKGLILVEKELKSEGETLLLPDFIGKEVTGEEKFYNKNLAKG